MEKSIRKPGYSIEHDSWFIPLTQGVIALVDADMVPILSQHNWHANKVGGQWRAMRSVMVADGEQTAELMHRIAMDAPIGMVIDHITHHPISHKIIDNRRSNLRICTHAENLCSKRAQRGGSSAFKGVYRRKDRQKWCAQIGANGALKHLGYFADEVEAARAYDAAAIEMFGEYALTNHSLGYL